MALDFFQSRVRNCKGGIVPTFYIHTYPLCEAPGKIQSVNRVSYIPTYIPIERIDTLATYNTSRSYIPMYTQKEDTQRMNKVGMYMWHWIFFQSKVRNCKGGIVPTYLRTYKDFSYALPLFSISPIVK